MSEVLYRCENPACPLGSLKQPGLFTGGITANQVFVLTGRPEDTLEEGEDFGEGFCPTCGVEGEKEGVHEELPEGDDPYDDLHQLVAARVADPADKLTADTAQDELHVLVAGREGEGDDDAQA